MSKLISLALTIVISATLAIAEPNQPESTEVQQEPNLVADNNAVIDMNKPFNVEFPYSVRLAKEELRGEFYEHALKIYQREVEHFKWYITSIIAIFGIAIAYFGINKKREITQTGKKQIEELDKEAEKQKEISVFWNKGNDAYREKDYDAAIKIWQKLYEEYKLTSRPFFNNWGSSLFNLAKQRTGDEKKRLLLEAAEKYKKAEDFTRGIMAYNLASIYSLLDREDECKKWLEVAKETGRMRPKAKFSQDYDFEKMWDKEWFKLFMKDLPE